MNHCTTNFFLTLIHHYYYPPPIYIYIYIYISSSSGTYIRYALLPQGFWGEALKRFLVLHNVSNDSNSSIPSLYNSTESFLSWFPSTVIIHHILNFLCQPTIINQVVFTNFVTNLFAGNKISGKLL